eukprot:SAG22_NODE_1576_length_4074_cov_3.474717_4_plen_93_part_00
MVMHNEVAPAQHEFAPIFTVANAAADQNVFSMDVLHHTAIDHGLHILYHEKPFKGYNGSGASRPALSCPALPCPALPCPVLSCPVLSCPVLS